jgi:hypothetical protein
MQPAQPAVERGRRPPRGVPFPTDGLVQFVGPAASQVAAYIRERQDEEAPPATVRNELAALKRMFALRVQAGEIAQRPHIPAIQVSNTHTGFFEHTDFAPLLAELPD